MIREQQLAIKRQQLISRLNYLYSTERFFVYVFSSLTLYVLLTHPIHNALLLYGLVVVTYILFQGQRYWQLKLFRVTGKPIQEAGHLAFFRRAKGINQWLVGLMPLICLLQFQLLGWQVKSTNMLLLSVLTNGFGVLEYVNYYHRQLMIDTIADARYLRRHKKLKAASLAKDLAGQKI